jgi:hypothetical protein
VVSTGDERVARDCPRIAEPSPWKVADYDQLAHALDGEPQDP